MKKIIRILILLITLLGITLPQSRTTQAGKASARLALIPSQSKQTSPPKPVGAEDEGWYIECVDCPKEFSFLTERSLRLDSAGNPHIAYGDDHLYYAWHDGSAWHYETVDDNNRVGRLAALVLDDQGRPHISYVDDTINGLKYAYLDSDAWQIHSLFKGDDQIEKTAIDVDGDGYPHISYITVNVGETGAIFNLRYAFRDSDDWHYEILESVSSEIGNTSLAVDASGSVHISYDSNGQVKYALRDSSGWSFQMVAAQGFIPTLAIDGLNRPHISYFDAIYGWPVNLKYAYKSGDNWNIQTVASEILHSTPPGLSMALDSVGQPYITITDIGNDDVILWSSDQGNWNKQIIDSGYTAWPSIDMDAQGRPHIVYIKAVYDGNVNTIKYAYLGASGIQIETVDTEGRVRGENSLVVDTLGYPHISYTKLGPSGHTLNYAFESKQGWQIQTVTNSYCESSLALDKEDTPVIFCGDSIYTYDNSSGWRAEKIGCVPNSQDGSDMALDTAGNPHLVVASHDCTLGFCEGNLTYAYHATSGWTCKTVDTNPSRRPSLALSQSNQPYISYNSYSINDDPRGLTYASLKTSGWFTQTIGGGGGGDSSLALDDRGFGQIAYYGDWPDYPFLNYAVQDTNGWNIEQLADIGMAEWDSFTSLALDSKGNPHIGYYVGIDPWLNYLKYTHREDGEWQTLIIDNQHGGTNSIALDIFGRTQISYHDPYNQDLRYGISPPPSFHVILSPSMNMGYTLPGSTLTHTLQVVNGGQQTDTYKVSVEDNIWSIQSTTLIGPLDYRESATLNIQVTVPPTATLGSTDTATITLTSQSDPSITATTTLTTYAAITTYLPLVER